MPHFPTHNPLKKELNLENIYQKLPIGIELYDKESNLIDTTNEINIREKLHAAEQEQRPALTADQRYSRFLKNRSQHIRHSSEEVRLQRNLRGDLCRPYLKNTGSCTLLFQSVIQFDFAIGCEFDCIGQEIGDYLCEPFRIGVKFDGG